MAPQGAKDMAVATDGDGTARTRIFDILRRKNWPAPYDFRAIRNALHRVWEERIEALRNDPTAARETYDAGVQAGDYTAAHATAGEAVGLVHDCPTAAEVVHSMRLGAEAALRNPRLQR